MNSFVIIIACFLSQQNAEPLDFDYAKFRYLLNRSSVLIKNPQLLIEKIQSLFSYIENVLNAM